MLEGLSDYAKLYQAGCVMNPDSSRSQVTLRSGDPFDSPRVATNLLASKSERERAGRCLKRLRAIFKNFPRSYGLKELLPGFAVRALPVPLARISAVRVMHGHDAGARNSHLHIAAGSVADIDSSGVATAAHSSHWSAVPCVLLTMRCPAPTMPALGGYQCSRSREMQASGQMQFSLA